MNHSALVSCPLSFTSEGMEQQRETKLPSERQTNVFPAKQMLRV